MEKCASSTAEQKRSCGLHIGTTHQNYTLFSERPNLGQTRVGEEEEVEDEEEGRKDERKTMD